MFIFTGWVGIPLAFTVFCIQVYTAILLGKCWVIAESLEADISSRNRSPYAALAEMAYGRRTGTFVTLILGLTIFGGGIPNLLIASQNLQVMGLKLSSFEMDFSYCYWMIIIGLFLCPLMWLGSPKDMKWLALVSVFTVTAASILTWVCLIKIEVDSPPPVPSPTWESVAIAYGILAFQFDIHPMILTVQIDMKDKNRLGQAILLGFLVSGGMFLITTILVYTKLGTDVHYNTLQGLRTSVTLYAAIFLVTLQICLSMVVGSSPLFQNIEDKLQIDPKFNWKRILVRTLLTLLGVAIAEAVPRFDLIMGLVGGSLTGQLMFIFPPLIYARLRSLQARRRVESYVATHSDTFLGPPKYGTIADPEDRALVFGLAPNDPTTFEDNAALVPRERFLKAVQRPVYGLPSSSMQVVPKRKAASISDHLYDIICLDKALEEGPMSLCEKAFNGILLSAGVAATLISTYFSLQGTIEYGEFVPSCVVNVTMSFRL
ncbi:hypothetical protein AAG570_010993 [Ranatra chinensis]|uniref:Amino acid transporter transmembrane domain-containing protein n=1 Tax=Ranatra chinensis TaxID=642074 RepID=A0ABD0YJK9_9HEMI